MARPGLAGERAAVTNGLCGGRGAGGGRRADLSGLFMPRTRQEKRLMRVPAKGDGEART